LLAAGGLLPAQTTLNPVPGRILGHAAKPDSLTDVVFPATRTPNLPEGREFFAPQSVAVDTTGAEPILYVADTGNHRVLVFRGSDQWLKDEWGRPRLANLVLGQRDFYTTAPTGPGFGLDWGFTTPSSVALDKNGNLFVYDAGNNRVLRFPKPLEQTGDDIGRPDLIIGQPSLKQRNPNMSTNANQPPSASSLKSNSNATGLLAASIAFDNDGNLWVVDPGNNRALRFPSEIVGGPRNVEPGFTGIQANVVLGQPDFNTALINPGQGNKPENRLNKTRMRYPSAVAVDSQGNVFVSDDLSRILVWRRGSLVTNANADRIMGLVVAVPGQPAPPAVNNVGFAFNFTNTGILDDGPRAIWTSGDVIFVADTENNRILRFPPLADWPAESTSSLSPSAEHVVGQEDFFSGQANRTVQWEPTSHSLAGPAGGGVATYSDGRKEFFIADTRNHRVLVFPDMTAGRDVADAVRLVGQLNWEYRSVNYIEGREVSMGSVQVPVGQNRILTLLGLAVALDEHSSPPRLYISDTGNNRILCYADARKVNFDPNGVTDRADFIIGQVDPFRGLINSPTNDINSPSDTGMFLPTALKVDEEGNLWVADTGNGRILRFPRPFDTPGNHQKADLVLGRPDFSARVNSEVAKNTLFRPTGITFTMDGDLVVSDLGHNRVLMFQKPFGTGMEAALVLGQPDFFTQDAGGELNRLNLPFDVAIDPDNRLYVADYGNARIAVWNRITEQQPDSNMALAVRFPNPGITPTSLTVNHETAELWVTDDRRSTNYPWGRLFRFPRYDQLAAQFALTGEFAPTWVAAQYLPGSPAFDTRGALYMVDAGHRMTVLYPAATIANWGSGSPLATPGMVAQLKAPGLWFSDEVIRGEGSPLPKTLNDYTLYVNGTPAPIIQMRGDEIRFQVPNNAPTNGGADFMLRKESYEDTVAYARWTMSPASPAMLTANSPGGGQIRAINQNGKENSLVDPAKPGEEITLFLTGYGPLANAPEDGTAGEVEVPVDGQLFIASAQTAAEIISSTLDPSEPGVWRIKAKIPSTVTGNPQRNFVAPTILLYKSIPSNLVNPVSNTRIETTLVVKP
jgi:uncharacterized protein (TIGR03437 family)